MSASAKILEDFPNSKKTLLLVESIQALSLAKSLPEIMEIVRSAVRKLADADGASFILREDNHCFYADEDAIGPLWKGKKFPLERCVSGWAMLHSSAVAIEDIYSDSRVPIDAYRPTFVKSLVVVPIRMHEPVGALGAYWASHHKSNPDELFLLQILANSTSVAMENVKVYGVLKDRVQILDRANYELKRFTWLASHDLKEPIRAVRIYSELLVKALDSRLSDEEKEYLKFVDVHSERMQTLVDDLLNYSNIENAGHRFREVDLSQIISEIKETYEDLIKSGALTIEVENLPYLYGDPILLRRVFGNFLSNAIKFRKADSAIEVRLWAKLEDDMWKIFVKDNGIGIEKEFHEKIFDYFSRLHSKDEYPGSGVGLAICRKIVDEIGGSVGVDSEPGQGACFFVRYPKNPRINW